MVPWLASQLPSVRRATRFDQVKDQLQTGDIILSAGTTVFSKLIQTITRSVWSHVAMVVRDGDEVLCWESGNKDVIEHDFAEEYKLATLIKAAGAEDVVVAVRMLDAERTEGMLECYRTFRDQVSGRPYERDKLELLKAALGLDIGPEDLSSLFCSELVAETWQRMGLLSEDKDSNWYAPKDFSSLGAVVPLRGSLGLERIIKE